MISACVGSTVLVGLALMAGWQGLLFGPAITWVVREWGLLPARTNVWVRPLVYRAVVHKQLQWSSKRYAINPRIWRAPESASARCLALLAANLLGLWGVIAAPFWQRSCYWKDIVMRSCRAGSMASLRLKSSAYGSDWLRAQAIARFLRSNVLKW